MRVKISLVIALLAAIAGIVWLLSRVQDANHRATVAEQKAEIAAKDADALRAWAGSVRDSLGRALAVLEPPGSTMLDDSTNAVFVARMAQASATFWFDEAQRARAAQHMLLQPHEVAALRAKGLEDPVKELREDLLRRPDLIPFEGVMGGRMQFVPDGIAVLSPEWVYARFEDGHVTGSCLLAFDVLKSGEIAWRRLAARQE